MLGTLLPGARQLQNIHPLIVHFPIAFLFGAALLYLLAWLAKRESWAWTGLWLLSLGTLGAAAAVASGLYGAEGVMVARSVREHLLVNHQRIMLGVLALSVVLSAWAWLARPIPHRGGVVFLFLLAILIAGLTVGADFGGRMVYDYNAGGNACPQPIEFHD
ncbi:MAG TPA: DUF2231 domain-containing protein [Candidatus Binataceae bacterium]|nr:DUF2231 domain-containing protein [Candidatus Binataceae bacterium]